MVEHLLNKDLFCFKYLPDYADFLLKNKLTEFVTIGIRFCREVDLPLLKPLSRFSEEELVALSIDSNKKILEALAKNQVAELIEQNIKQWESNTLNVVSKDEVVAEDLTLGFFLRRKIFAYFLDGYTKNVVEQKFIIAELDIYTTREELISYHLYIKNQQEKLALVNNELNFHKELLLEAQELVGVGSFQIHVQDPSKCVYTPEYFKIFEMGTTLNFQEFLEHVHPEDREEFTRKIMNKEGGKFELNYRYRKNGREKKIWSKGFILTQAGKPLLVRGIVKEMEA